jgi:hypothetical protein
MRFAVLHHTRWPGHADHYDLLLQVAKGRSDDDRVLRALATPGDRFPLAGSRAGRGSDAGPRPQTLRALPDHRRAYLTYQGPVSGGRGRVRRVDAGRLEWLGRGRQGRCLRFRLAGRRLRGTFRLSPKKGKTCILERLP